MLPFDHEFMHLLEDGDAIEKSAHKSLATVWLVHGVQTPIWESLVDLVKLEICKLPNQLRIPCICCQLTGALFILCLIGIQLGHCFPKRVICFSVNSDVGIAPLFGFERHTFPLCESAFCDALQAIGQCQRICSVVLLNRVVCTQKASQTSVLRCAHGEPTIELVVSAIVHECGLLRFDQNQKLHPPDSFRKAICHCAHLLPLGIFLFVFDLPCLHCLE